MLANVVGDDVFVDVDKMGALLQRFAGAGESRVAVGDDKSGIEQFFFAKRRQTEDNRGWEAARIGHEPTFADRFAVQLRQSVDGFRHPFRAGVVSAVPFFVHSRVVETEIRAQVDHLDAHLDEGLGVFRRCAVGQRQKDNVAVLVIVKRQIAEARICQLEHTLMKIRNRPSRAARADGDELDTRRVSVINGSIRSRCSLSLQ